MASAQWTLSGLYYDICSCNVPCPCWWGISKPTKNGVCEFFNGFNVKSGKFGGTDLSGLSVVMPGNFTGLAMDGNWHVGLYVDARATEEQRRAIAAIYSGEAGGVPGELKGFIKEVKGVKYVPIDYRDDGRKFHFKIGTVGEARGSLLKGGREDTPVRADNTMLEAAMGLTEALTNFRTDVFTYNDADFGWRWDNSGQNVWRAGFSWSGGQPTGLPGRERR